MHPPVRQTIRELRLTRVARKMGLPISTVFRWMTQDRIPGKGRAHDWRVAQFEAAVSELRAETSKAIPTEGAER
jgi:predicted DNA-binding transcriptional regulator AlpA